MTAIEKRTWYLCQQQGLNDYGLMIYGSPILYKSTLAPSDTMGRYGLYLEELGYRVSNTVCAVLPYAEMENIKEGDKAYLYEAVGDQTDDVNASKANYYVRSVRPQNKKTCVYFSKLVKE